MYEQNTCNYDYFKSNDLKANKIISGVLYCFLIIWPIMAFLSYINVFSIPARNIILTFTCNLIAIIILFVLQRKNVPYYFIKYYCLIAFEILIGTASAFPSLNFSILFVAAPIMSCVYFNKNLTQNVSLISWFVMTIDIGIRTSQISNGTPFIRSVQFFLKQLLHNSVEYIIITFICYIIAFRARLILNEVLSRKQKIQLMQEQMIFSFANLIESKDNITGQHVKRTSAYVKLITSGLEEKGYYRSELDRSAVECIYMAAPIHDIGKMKIPESILCKPSGLTPEEFECMKTHTTKGSEIIQKTMHKLENDKFLFYATNMALYHHEKWDGTGYPEGLAGQKIPLCARIMAVADVFDALVSSRSYKKPMTVDEAFANLESNKGTQFEPLIVDIFISQKERIKVIYNKIS